MFIVIWLALTCSLLLAIFLGYRFSLPEIIFAGLWFSYGLIYIYPWFNTYYKLTRHEFIYRSGIFAKGRIAVNSIYKIENSSFYAGSLKASLAGKGLLIRYNTYDDLFIAPKDQAGFIAELLQLNPAIEYKAGLELKAVK